MGRNTFFKKYKSFDLSEKSAFHAKQKKLSAYPKVVYFAPLQ